MQTETDNTWNLLNNNLYEWVNPIHFAYVMTDVYYHVAEPRSRAVTHALKYTTNSHFSNQLQKNTIEKKSVFVIHIMHTEELDDCFKRNGNDFSRD